MAEADRFFDYVAIDRAGKRVRGSVSARTDQAAFERLKRDGLSPLKVSGARTSTDGRVRGLTDRETAEFLSDLSALLGAGTDMRTALSILAGRGERQPLRVLAKALSAEIGGGGAMDSAFAARLGKNGPFVGALVSSGDLAAGLQRAADMLESRVKLKDQLVSVLSYPAFVFLSTLAALAVIILFVVPALAPLVSESGGHPPLILGLMVGLSDFLHGNATLLLGSFAALIGALAVAAKTGVLGRVAEQALLDGPFGRTVGGLVFGAFAIALGNMLAAGAPMSEALRLAIRSVPSRAARERLDPVTTAVRQGQPLSAALSEVRSFPDAIVRLSSVGEVTGALGSMLSRGGKLEEDAALKRIDAAGRMAGPLLIVGLGAIIGLMMGGLLTGVSQLGQTALQ